MRILIVEDEKDLNRIITKGLKKIGYAVDSAFDGEEALYLFEVNEYDLILLDLNIPKIDGLEVLKEIRKKDLMIKIMILSARTKIEERIIGLDLGANDYMIKPFDFKELEARIRTLFRIKYTQIPSILTCFDLKINTNTRKAYIKDEEVALARKEFCILEYLMINKERLIPTEEIFEHVWDEEADEFSNTIKFHIHSLKRKLSAVSDFEYIINKRGYGYMMRSEDAQD